MSGGEPPLYTFVKSGGKDERSVNAIMGGSKRAAAAEMSKVNRTRGRTTDVH